MCVCVEERTSHHVLFSLQKKMAFLRNLSLALALAGLAQGPDAQYVLVQVTQTKDAADSLCQAVGGALAVVATEDELIFLGRYIASLSSSASYVFSTLRPGAPLLGQKASLEGRSGSEIKKIMIFSVRP